MEDKIREIIRQELDQMIANDRFVFKKMLELQEAVNIKTGAITGTKIGTSSTNKLSFYGVTPVDQPATIQDPAGGTTVDSQARGAINSILDRLIELGLIAPQ